MSLTNEKNPYLGVKNEANHATAQADRLLKKMNATAPAPVAPKDRLIDFRRVHELVGSKCQTGHCARALYRKGLIRGVALNQRTIRYSEASVLALVAGGAS
jgi:hypothetical protein